MTEQTATTDLRKHFTDDVVRLIVSVRASAAKSGNPQAYISAMLETIRECHPNSFGTAVCNGLMYFSEDAGLLEN
jgi:hypothetical protein